MAVFKYSFTLEVGKLRIDADGLDVVLDPGLRMPFVRTTFLGAAASPEERAMCTGGIVANYDASTPGVVEMAGGVIFQERPGYDGRKVILPKYKFVPDGENIGMAHGMLLFSEQLPLDVRYIHVGTGSDTGAGRLQTLVWSARKVLADERVSGIEEIVTEPGNVVRFGFPDDVSEEADRWLLLGGKPLRTVKGTSLYDAFPWGSAFYVRILRTP
ncbi:hypothetical protein HYU15_03550 [Candidatus Woesearchaeota archaeon]|nr:hypothetical protein [Candidatus Woesearchaeota archaeon]